MKWTSAGYVYGAGGTYCGVPDVAMDADPNTGMLIGLTQTFSDEKYYDEYRIGGTSLASPLFAGITALKVQANGGKGYGLLNPIVYDKNNAAALTDVTHAAKYTFDQDASLTTGKGWDDVTGLGTPNAGWLKK